MISEIDFVFLSDHSFKDCIGGQYIEGLVCPAHFFFLLGMQQELKVKYFGLRRSMRFGDKKTKNDIQARAAVCYSKGRKFSFFIGLGHFVYRPKLRSTST